MLPAPYPIDLRQSAARDFASTHWSVVLTAGKQSSAGAEQAMETLCRSYWPAIYSFIRRQGHGPEEAKDFTQEFFRGLLGKNALANVDPSKGRFRSFLLASVKNLMANEWHRARTRKRGGGAPKFSLDEKLGEERYHVELADILSPDKLFDRRWAETLLERVLLRLRDEWNARDKQQRFDDLKVFLVERRGTVPFPEAAARLGITVPALRSMLHRLRQSYREVFTQEIAHTVAAPEEIEDEVRHLLAALND